MEKIKIDEIECEKQDLTKLIEKYHDLNYFVEITTQNFRFAGWGYKTATYLVSVYKLVKDQEEAANE